MSDRVQVSINDVAQSHIDLPSDHFGPDEDFEELRSTLALPSYVHGYSLAIEYMRNWFESKFPKNYFRGGIYVDGKHVLDDYKRLNDYMKKSIIKGQNPRARMEPRVQFDYDRDQVDLYAAAPEIYLKRSKLQTSFFHDFDRHLYLGFMPRALRMDVNFKVRVDTRSQQLDAFNRMELYFRNGSSQYDYISVDFHVPKTIILDIAQQAGFEIKNNEVADTIAFMSYLNKHSELPFLFKLRAINQKTEYFIRVNQLYARIFVRDKLQLDDGERDGKLDFNYHVEMSAELTIPIPHYYSYYSADNHVGRTYLEDGAQEGVVSLYSINAFDIPKENELGWMQVALTEYMTDPGETEADVSAIFSGDNALTRAINISTRNGLSPAKYIDIQVYREEDKNRIVDVDIDWENFIIKFKIPEDEELLHIVVYYDHEYVNNLIIETEKLEQKRLSVEHDTTGRTIKKK